MGKGLFDLVLQTTMMGGLMAVFILLVAPFLNIGGKNRVPVPTQYVLEVTDSLAATRRMVVGRIKKLLSQGDQPNQIEVVAVSNGINILMNDSSYARELEAFMVKGVKFTACKRALDTVTHKIGHSIALIDGVNIVADGHVYAEGLKDGGYIDELA